MILAGGLVLMGPGPSLRDVRMSENKAAPEGTEHLRSGSIVCNTHQGARHTSGVGRLSAYTPGGAARLRCRLHFTVVGQWWFLVRKHRGGLPEHGPIVIGLSRTQ